MVGTAMLFETQPGDAAQALKGAGAMEVVQELLEVDNLGAEAYSGES